MSSFEIKGKVAPCTVFRPLATDLVAMRTDLLARLEQMPGFFRDMAIIIDFSALGQLRNELDLNGLVHLLRGQGLAPVGIQGGNEFHERLASKLYLGIFSEQKNTFSKTQLPAQPVVAPTEQEALLIDKPVRSGQQVYARGRDLIVLAPVGPGAEVIADGNVHIYATLRGRALAGVMGNEQARIFCKELKAELVSVAGLYRVSEDLPPEVQGSSVQIRLDGRQLLIEPL